MNQSRVLVTGGTGLLGKALLESAPPGWTVHATFHRQPPPPEWRGRFLPLELQQEASIARLFQEARPEVVIHAASVGSVDEAERQPEQVQRINLHGTQRIAEACLRDGARLIFISSNAVFDGKNPPYSEKAPVCPINRYGAMKAEAERWLQGTGLSLLVVRPILIYGWPSPGGRENAVTRWVAALERGRRVRVAKDIVSTPLWAGSCAGAIWSALRKELSGILHVAGPDRVSLDEFARETARVFGFDPGWVEPVLNQELGLAAPRPPDTSFDIQRMRSELGVEPLGIREGLAQMARARLPVR